MNILTPVLSDPDPAPSVFTTPPGQVVRSTIFGQPIFFTITNHKDAIQRYHARGEFYEAEELEIIRRHFRPGSVFCDIGANIGNHTLFAMKYLHAASAILFEPNPQAIAILRSNLELNGLTERVDLTNLGFGLSDDVASGLRIEARRSNLGAGRMVEGDGTLHTLPGDTALAGRHVDFVKIDVEGMEMRVLSGLKETLARCRPRIFVEVDRQNTADFRQWAAQNSYSIRARYRRYKGNENFLLEPVAPAIAQA